jgi:hypothetical protein
MEVKRSKAAWTSSYSDDRTPAYQLRTLETFSVGAFDAKDDTAQALHCHTRIFRADTCLLKRRRDARFSRSQLCATEKPKEPTENEKFGATG